MLTLAVAFGFHNKAPRFVKDARVVAMNALCGGLEVIDDLFPVGHASFLERPPDAATKYGFTEEGGR